MTPTQPTAFPGRYLWLLLVLLACALPAAAEAQQENRLRRIQILPRQGFTRINLFFQDPPDYTVSRLSGQVRLTVKGASAPVFRKFRSYTDPRIGGVFCSGREGGVRVTIAVKDGASAVQALSYGNPTLLSLDVGPAVKRVQHPDIAPGREPILSGIEQFVREFGTPAAAGLPFVPTDAKLLKGLLSEDELTLFQQGEGLLYNEQASQAIEIFSLFLDKPAALRAIAGYRLGAALCQLDRCQEALGAFRQAEALWPDYLEQSPELLESYAEARVKTGDFAGGRALLMRLMGKLYGTAYLPPLLNRLAYMSEHYGDAALALAMYRSVVVHAPGSAAAARARMKLADRDMFSLSRDRYRTLLLRYQSIYQAPGDFLLRDEALFKVALVQALYGPAREALEAAITYEKRYPRGIFSTIVKKMREELLLPVYGELYAAGDHESLVRLALDNKEYLARCFSDQEFVKRLSQGFHGTSLLTREIELFSYLAERDWAASGAPFMAWRIVEDAVALGNLSLVESASREFLARFPGDARTGRVREQLGRIAFEKGDLKTVAAELRFLGAKGKRAELPESDYYLGKALLAAGDQRGAERSLVRFTAEGKEGSPLLLDGYFCLAGARVALKEHAGALAAYQQGGKIASGETADQFLYKTGELHLQLGQVRQAMAAWEQVAGRGGDGTWAKLAREALGDLQWRLKISGELP